MADHDTRYWPLAPEDQRYFHELAQRVPEKTEFELNASQRLTRCPHCSSDPSGRSTSGSRVGDDDDSVRFTEFLTATAEPLKTLVLERLKDQRDERPRRGRPPNEGFFEEAARSILGLEDTKSKLRSSLERNEPVNLEIPLAYQYQFGPSIEFSFTDFREYLTREQNDELDWAIQRTSDHASSRSHR